MTGLPSRLVLPSTDPRRNAWWCLGQADPPGDLDPVLLAATGLRDRAQLMRAALAGMRRVSDLSGSWTGEAAGAFRKTLHEPARVSLDDLPARLDHYADALCGYADAASAARSAATAARFRLRDLLAAPMPGVEACPTPAAVPVGGTDPQAGALRETTTAFVSAYNGWVDAVAACTDRLRSVGSSDSLRNPHGWQAFVDDLSGIAGDVSTVTGVLGVVASFVCPPVGAGLLLASAVSAATSFGADLDRREQYGEDVNALDLCVDALGFVPMAGMAHGIRGAAEAVHAGESLASTTRAAVRPVLSEVTDNAGRLREPLTWQAPRLPERSTLRPVVLSWPAVRQAGETWGQTVLEVPANYADDAADNPDGDPLDHLLAPYRQVLNDLSDDDSGGD